MIKDELNSNDNVGNYEYVSHPSHYNTYDVETVEMIDRIWGHFIASKWCEINAFKYRMRLGNKPDNSIDQDIKKEQTYLSLYKKYKDKWKSEATKVSCMTKEECEYYSSIINDTPANVKRMSDDRIYDGL